MIRITYKKQSYPRFSAQDVRTILRKNGDKKLPWNKEPQVEKSKDPMAIELARRLAKGLPDNPLEMDIQERYNAKKGHEEDADLRYGASTTAAPAAGNLAHGQKPGTTFASVISRSVLWGASIYTRAC